MQPNNNEEISKPSSQGLPTDTISALTQDNRETTTQDQSNSSSLTTQYIPETGSQTNFLSQNYIRYTNSRGVIPNYIIFINDNSVSSISATSHTYSVAQEPETANTSETTYLPPNRPEDHPIQEIQTSRNSRPEYIYITPELRLGKKCQAKRARRTIKK
jgi:hypothetical protein